LLRPMMGTLLGWTHSCGSGKSIARIVSGLKPELDFAFVGV
jgi:D-amino-acid dehydrogenase